MGTLNTGSAISTVYRSKYRLATLDAALRKALIAEKICAVDRTDVKYINSPYGNQPTASIKTINGSYTVCDFTTTEDVLTVTDEFTYAEHIYDYEQTLTQFDMFAARTDEMVAAIAMALDKWVDKYAHYKSSLINGENLIAKAKATLKKAYSHLQRLSERTFLMNEATVRTA